MTPAVGEVRNVDSARLSGDLFLEGKQALSSLLDFSAIIYIFSFILYYIVIAIFVF